MRALSDDETRLVFEKLKKYIGQNLRQMVDRPDGIFLFRLHKERVFYMSERLLKHAGHIPKKELLSAGVCIGKFTHSRKFRLQITALDYLVMMPAVLEAIELKAAEPVEAIRPQWVESRVSFCSCGYFCQDTSTELVAIAYTDLPVGRLLVLAKAMVPQGRYKEGEEAKGAPPETERGEREQAKQYRAWVRRTRAEEKAKEKKKEQEKGKVVWVRAGFAVLVASRTRCTFSKVESRCLWARVHGSSKGAAVVVAP
eukprot:symbB.v1.2.029039.t1/scaffold3137.1/size62610/1